MLCGGHSLNNSLLTEDSCRLKAACLMLELNEFGCYKAKTEESEKAAAGSSGLFTYLYFHLHLSLKVYLGM